jgi:hypothetical protein
MELGLITNYTNELKRQKKLLEENFNAANIPYSEKIAI